MTPVLQWEEEGRRLQNTTGPSGLPLLAGEEGKEEQGEEDGSERDSGTGDSKRSYEHDTEPSIVDHVIHNFLSARGEAGEWGAAPSARSATSVCRLSASDLDTQISLSASGVSSSAAGPRSSLHRKGCPRLRSIPPPPKSQPQSLAVDNPLYDSLPVRAEEAVPSAPPSEEGAVSPPASIISDSVAYCGRFPKQVPNLF